MNIRKSKVKTFRLEENLNKLLRECCQRQNVSESVFISEILAWRLTISPLIPAFDGIILGKDTFATILASADFDTLELSGYELGKKHYYLAKSLFESRGNFLTFHQFLRDVLDGHGRWFKTEGNPAETPGWLTLRHEQGKKWSVFLGSYLSGAYSVTSREHLRVESSEGLLKIGFKPLDSQPRGELQNQRW